jgi:uncharacterized membrane protein YfcA
MMEIARTLSVAAPIVVLIGVDKGGFAGSFGLLAVPLMALVLPPLEATGILLPVLLVMDAYALWVYRRAWDRRSLWPLVSGALVGLGVGWLFMDRVSEAAVRIAIGATAFAFVVARAFSTILRARPIGRPGVFWGAMAGVLAGFASFVAHAGGPPIQMYLIPAQLDRRVFIGTTVVFFAVLNVLKVLPYASLGLLSAEHLMKALVLLPFGPVGIALGRYVADRLSERFFYHVVNVMLVVVGAKLVWDGLCAGS